MSSYFATTRKENSGRVQGGGPTEYVRSAPSNLGMKIINASFYLLSSILYAFLPSVALAFLKDNVFTPLDSKDYYELQGRASETFNIRTPNVSMRFKGRPPVDINDRLLELGATIVKLPGTTTDTYLLENTTYEILGEITAWSHHLIRMSPPQGFICGTAILAYADTAVLLSTLTQLARAVAAGSRGLRRGEPTVQARIKREDVPIPTFDVEEGEVGAILTDEQQEEERNKPIWVPFAKGLDETPLRVRISKDPMLTGTFVESHVLSAYGGAVFVFPFESNYAAPDYMALMRLLRTFPGIGFDTCDEESERIEEWVDRWVKDIANTQQGDWMAHMMAILVLAKESAGSPIFVRTEDGEYLGGIIAVAEETEFLVFGGKKTVALTGTSKIAALSAFSSNIDVLTEIGSIAGITCDGIRSMRELHIELTRHGLPSSAVLTQVRPLLAKLRFQERPEKYNAETISQMFEFLADPTKIPPKTYMPSTSVYCVNPVENVICMFGSNPPSFNFGGPDSINASPVIARGVPDAKAYRPTPVGTFQSKRMPMNVAIGQYEIMMRNGLISTHTSRALPGSRVFSTSEGLKVWAALGELLSKTVERPGTSHKRKGDDEVHAEPSTNAPRKRAKGRL